MRSPRRVKGFGPSSTCATGITGYQKRRRTFCLVTSMVDHETRCYFAAVPHDQRDGKLIDQAGFVRRCAGAGVHVEGWKARAGDAQAKAVALRDEAARRSKGNAQRPFGGATVALSEDGRLTVGWHVEEDCGDIEARAVGCAPQLEGDV